MTAYYNEIDPYAAQWLRNLISAGQIAPGDVDERSIVDVRADDLRGYTQVHFFAGIGGWSIALRLAGWPDERPVWTGSCPCQPFSAAGAGKAADDERHLWPTWFPLIAQCSPPVVFGEQVEAAVGWGWLDAVFADLEGEGYACGATVLPACGVGGPHIRQRLWFVGMADAASTGPFPGTHAGISREEAGPAQKPGRHGRRYARRGGSRQLGDAAINGSRPFVGQPSAGARPKEPLGGSSISGELGHAIGEGFQEQRGQRGFSPQAFGAEPRQAAIGTGPPTAGFWSDAEWIACTDGKARPVGPGSFPLGHGIQRRASKLRAYGNAIVPQVAAEFIRAAVA